jgi:glutaminase
MPSPEIRRTIKARLQELHERCLTEPPRTLDRFYSSGRGYYPPADAGREKCQFGIALATTDGEVFTAGDCTVRFPLHSISKVFAYGLALSDHGPAHVLERVGVEPSGDAFNALRFDERNMRPFNPMVNAGALVTSDLVQGNDREEQFDRILETLHRYAGHDELTVDEETFEAEVRTADHNRGCAYLMRSLGMLDGDVEAILALYLRQCAVHVTATDLAVMAATLGNGGVNSLTGATALPRRRVRDVLSVMYTCGMYDYAGHWTFDVGLPAKSGVSGGIMAVVPGKMGLGVFSPGLDVYGNSVRGIQVCKEISERLGLHTFASEDEDAMTSICQ